ncbi:MAG: AraC family transcriptional regulator ligand-binding domain-containing protein [Archangium sp.]|nr:AraC family transcriptional regulator ligand-binding domain-containing protein [Archangium sp.]
MTIRSQAVGPLLQAVKASGADEVAFARRFGLAPSAATAVQVELELATLRTLFVEAAAVCRAEDFGVQLALNLPRGRYGLVEYGTFSAPTLGAAVKRLVRLSALVNPGARYELDELRASWRLTQRFPPWRDGLGRHGNEFNVVAIVQMGRAVLRERWAPSKAWFSNAKPADTSALEKAMGTNQLRFDADGNGIELPASLLAREVPTADAALLALMDKYAEQELAALPRGDDIVSRTAHALRDELHAGAPRISTTASRLKLSSRTLQRRLEQAGTSFAEVLESVRHQVALHYVNETNAPLAEVAFTLGYADMPSFLRAFKRWTGKRPSELRGSSLSRRA